MVRFNLGGIITSNRKKGLFAMGVWGMGACIHIKSRSTALGKEGGYHVCTLFQVIIFVVHTRKNEWVKNYIMGVWVHVYRK